MRCPRRLASAAAAVALLVGPAGCTDDEPSAPPPVRPSTTSSTPQADPTPPELPDAAREHTTAGAKAFVRYFADVLAYAHAIESGGPLRGITTEVACVCNSFSDRIDQVRRDGGHQTGGEWSILAQFALASLDPDEANLSVQVRNLGRSHSVDAEDEPQPIKSRDMFMTFFTVWRDSRWLLLNVVPE